MIPLIRIQPAEAEQATAIRALMRVAIDASLVVDEQMHRELVGNVEGNVDLWLREPARCLHLVAMRGTRLAGVVMVKDHWNLCSLFVAPAVQRSGVGRLLLEAAMSACRGKSPKRAIHLNSTPGAVPFYRRCGFTDRAATRELPPGFEALCIAV